MYKINRDLLCNLIIEKGFTYSKISQDLNLSRGTIYNFSIGRTIPNVAFITNLANALELTQEEFMAIFFPNLTFKKEF